MHYLTEDGVAKTFDISRTTLWTLRKKGLPHYRVGSLVRYDLNEVIEWLRTHTVESQNEKSGDENNANIIY